jgi:hypothetical protein
MASVGGLAGDERGFTLQLEEVEVALLLSLAAQMIDFIAPVPTAENADPLAAMVGIDATAMTPEDPALERLLPDAYRDDAEAAGEFRRFTERGLRESKVANARAVQSALEEADGEVEVGAAGLSAWLGFLNDTRLTLGTRLDISEDNHDELAELPPEDPRSGLFQVYDWLTFLQESIVQRLLPSA